MALVFDHTEVGERVTQSGSGTIEYSGGAWTTVTTPTLTLHEAPVAQDGKTALPNLTAPETYDVSLDLCTPMPAPAVGEGRGVMVLRITITGRQNMILAAKAERNTAAGWKRVLASSGGGQVNLYTFYFDLGDNQILQKAVQAAPYYRQDVNGYLAAVYTRDLVLIEDAFEDPPQGAYVVFGEGWPNAALVDDETPTREWRFVFERLAETSNADFITFDWQVDWIPLADVYTPDDTTPPEDPDLDAAYALDEDRTYIDAARQAYQPRSGGSDLYLRRSDNLEASYTASLLPFTGKAPSILCQDSGRILIGYNDAGAIKLQASDNDGETWGAIVMTPEPTGYFSELWTDRNNPESVLLLGACTVATGDGDLIVYRSWDQGATRDAGSVTVVANVPAQRPVLTGNAAEIVCSYFLSTGAIAKKKSTDQGATWS